MIKNKTFRRMLESDSHDSVSPTGAMSTFKNSNNASKGSSRKESLINANPFAQGMMRKKSLIFENNYGRSSTGQR
jgi:hypothetical protein